jgi:hypothetical protein
VTEQAAATGAVPSSRRRSLRPPTLVGYLLVFGLGAAAVAPFTAAHPSSQVADSALGQTGGSTSGGTSGGAGTTGTTGTTGATGATGAIGSSGTSGAGTTGGVVGSGATAGGTSGSTGSTTGPTSTGPQRFASDVGVTKDVIKIGYINVDCKTCKSVNIPSSSERGNYFKAFVADINARGGINGRKVEPYVSSYDPVADALNGSGGEHKSCLDLTEKVKIWVYIGFSISETECIAGAHKTPMVGDNGGLEDPKDFNRLGGRVWSVGASWRRNIVDWVAKLDSLNLVRDKKFSLVYAEAAGGPTEKYLLPLLKARGLAPARVKNLGADIQQWQPNISQEVPAEKVAGITHVVFASNFATGAFWLDEAKRDGFFPQYLVSDYGGNADDYGAYNWEKNGSSFVGAIGVSSAAPTDDAQKAATPFGKGCVDTWKKRSGRAVPVDDAANLINVCLDVALFERAARAAGPNPTRAGWIQAMARTGTFDDPLAVGGSGTLGVPYPFGPVRWSGVDHSVVSQFKSPCPHNPFDSTKNECWVPIGPVQKMAA